MKVIKENKLKLTEFVNYNGTGGRYAHYNDASSITHDNKDSDVYYSVEGEYKVYRNFGTKEEAWDYYISRMPKLPKTTTIAEKDKKTNGVNWSESFCNGELVSWYEKGGKFGGPDYIYNNEYITLKAKVDFGEEDPSVLDNTPEYIDYNYSSKIKNESFEESMKVIKENIENLERVKDKQTVQNVVMADAEEESKIDDETDKLINPMKRKKERPFLGAKQQETPDKVKVPPVAKANMYTLDESLFEDLDLNDFLDFNSDFYNAIADVLFKYRDKEGISRKDVEKAYAFFDSHFYDSDDNENIEDESLKKEDSSSEYRNRINIIRKIDTLLPHSMRYKEADIVGNNLYWITQDEFGEDELQDAGYALEDFGFFDNFDKAYFILRDDSSYNLEKDKRLNADKLYVIDNNGIHKYSEVSESLNESSNFGAANGTNEDAYLEAKSFFEDVMGLDLPKDIFNTILNHNNISNDMEMPNDLDEAKSDPEDSDLWSLVYEELCPTNPNFKNKTKFPEVQFSDRYMKDGMLEIDRDANIIVYGKDEDAFNFAKQVCDSYGCEFKGPFKSAGYKTNSGIDFTLYAKIIVPETTTESLEDDKDWETLKNNKEVNPNFDREKFGKYFDEKGQLTSNSGLRAEYLKNMNKSNS